MDEKMTVIKQCKGCGDKFHITFYKKDYNSWKNKGVLIQNALPYLLADERELLLSSLCGLCFDKIDW